jgi:hypothetical protein
MSNYRFIDHHDHCYDSDSKNDHQYQLDSIQDMVATLLCDEHGSSTIETELRVIFSIAPGRDSVTHRVAIRLIGTGEDI